MAYKIVIVDDELLDLQALEVFFPWSDLGFEVVGAVNSGFLALELMNEHTIDLLITDIHMPLMTGLELARKAIDKQSDLRVMFISGHQEFNYVKAALSLQASGYLLKPFDDDEVKQSLLSIRSELDKERMRREAEENYKQLIPKIQKDFWQILLEDPANPQYMHTFNEIEEQLQLCWPIQVAVLEPDDLAWKLNHYSEHEKNEWIAIFRKYTYEACQERNINYVSKIGEHRLVILLENCLSRGVDLHDMNDRIQQELPFSITGGIGEAVYCKEKLRMSFKQAAAALDHKMFAGKGKWIAYSDIPCSEKMHAEHLDIQLDTLLESVANYELVKLHDELAVLFRMTAQWSSRFTVYNFVLHIVMKLQLFLHQENEDLFKILNLELKDLDVLLRFETINDIQSWLRRNLYEISELLNQKRQNKNSRLIRDVMDHIKEHLQENLTLRQMADRFTFSPNYLGLLFKEQTGKHYSEYVIELRMVKAAELLKDPTIKVYEVADIVGYRYLPYFSRQFKKSFGMTPNEYRKQV
ncbi:response regulator transcription factor [Paenibacillus sp. GXUN7292]|uniref:response regulator transcription factor n=1 Tax=Paenibacillus sp. GXUN7292 TaxID=3422499 RepID=UPI003D7E794D